MTPPSAPPPALDPAQLDPASLSGAQRSAVLLIALGVEAASKVLPLLPDADVERISVEIARFRNVSSEVVESVLMTYRDATFGSNHLVQGGKTVAREMLLNALGTERADQVMMKVQAATAMSAFQLLQTVTTEQIVRFIRNEHPQTAALILDRMTPRRASEVLALLDHEFQSEVVYRLATMSEAAPELLQEVEDVIRQELGPVFGGAAAQGGVEKVAAILNSAGRSTGTTIMESLRERSPDLAGSIKSFMFVFDDLITVSGRDLQRLLTGVDQKDLALALKGASDELKAKVLENVSDRVRESIVEEIELLGPVRVTDVEEAQQRIVEVAQDLEEREEIALSPQPAEEVLL